MVDCETYDLYLEWVETIWEPKHDFYAAIAEECTWGLYCGSTLEVVGLVQDPDGIYS